MFTHGLILGSWQSLSREGARVTGQCGSLVTQLIISPSEFLIPLSGDKERSGTGDLIDTFFSKLNR